MGIIRSRFGIFLAAMGALILSEVCFPRAAVSQPIPPTPTQIQLDSLFSAGAFQQLFDMASEYLAEAEAENDSVTMGRMLTAKGRGAVMLGKPDGVSILERSIDISRAVRDTTNWMAALGYKSLVFAYRGSYDESHELNVLRLELARATGDRASEAWARTMLGYIALLRGELDVARAEYTTAIDFFFEMDLRREALTPLVGLGRVYNSLHDVANARVCYQRALETAREVGDRVNEAHAVNNLGTLEYEFGDMELAVQYYERAQEMAAESGNMRGTITPSTNIALAMQYLGRYEEADSTLKAALELCEREGFDESIPMVLTGLAENNYLRHHFNASVNLYRRLLEMGSALPQKQFNEAVYGLARSLIFLGKPQEALDVLENNRVPAAETDVDLPTNWCKAECLLALDRPEEALEYSLEAERVRASFESELLSVPLALQLSRCYRQLGRTDEAIYWFEQAAARHSQRQSAISDYTWRESIGGTLILVDMSGVILERPGKSHREREAELFNLFQRFKVRTLIDRITEPRKKDEPLSHLAHIEPIDLRTVQNELLGPDELFLDFDVGDNIAFMFAITRDSCRVVKLPGKYSKLAKRVAVYQQFLGRRPEGDAGEAADFSGMNASMGEAILGGVADLVQSSATLIVSPASFYSGIPFGALALPDGDGEILSLISSKQIQRVPSATILAWLRSQDAKTPAEPPQTTVLAVAPVGDVALAGARREVESIQSHYTGVRKYSGSKNNAFTDNSPLQEVIHVAAHIEVNDEKPWHSGILMGDANGGHEFHADPYLRAGEIASLRIPARLAVLSGCESALGQQSVGEGVAGLTAAFLSAGVRSVVATLWRVDDAVTADLMERFYWRLSDGVSAAEALRAAQIETSSHSETRHPFYWAGFVIVGDGRVAVDLERKPWRTPNSLLLILLGIVAVSAAVGIFFRVKKL